MISSVNSGISMPMPTTRQEQKLTSDQQTLISDTLDQFDPDNLTKEDALTIVETLSEAGIQPGSSLESAMSDLGFNAQEIGDLVNPENTDDSISAEGGRPPPPPPPSQSSDEISEMVTYLSELLEEQIAASETNELTNDARDSIYAQVMEKFGIEDGDTIIDTTA